MWHTLEIEKLYRQAAAWLRVCDVGEFCTLALRPVSRSQMSAPGLTAAIDRFVPRRQLPMRPNDRREPEAEVVLR